MRSSRSQGIPAAADVARSNSILMGFVGQQFSPVQPIFLWFCFQIVASIDSVSGVIHEVSCNTNSAYRSANSTHRHRMEDRQILTRPDSPLSMLANCPRDSSAPPTMSA